MTMTATPRTVNAIGNGAATSFSFGTARIFAPTDLVVTVDSVVKTLGADYTVVNGNVVFSVAPADGAAVKIRSAIPLTRDTDLTAAGRITPTQVDADLDRLTAIVQELDEKIIDTATVAGQESGATAGAAAAEPYAIAAAADAIATAADRVQTGQDAAATAADAIATAADRVQTGQDAAATAAATAIILQKELTDFPDSVAGCNTVAALRLVSGTVDGQLLQVKGYYAADDGGGGPVRRWDAASTATDNGGTVIKPTAVSGAGRWIMFATGWINVLWFGVKNGTTADAANNYAGLKAAINFISGSSLHGVLYFPAGTYFTNELRDADGIDFRYVSFVGAGPRRSILKLANGRNLPLIDTSLYFETSLREMQFNGNVANNPGTTEIVKFSSGNVYAIDMSNVYFRDSAGDGLLIEGGQHFTLDHVMGKYCGGWGIRVNGSESVEIIHPDCEQNTLGGILVQGDPTDTPLLYRYYNPNIHILNPYVEANTVGIELRSICGVEVIGGYRNGGTVLKITADDGLPGYSHANRIHGTWEGKIIIESGCYGNYINTPTLNGRNQIDDQDGRNAIGPSAIPFLGDRHSRNFNGAAVGGALATNVSTWSTTTGSGHTVSKVSESVLPAPLAYNATDGVPRCLRVVASGTTSSTTSNNATALWPTEAVGYVYALLRAARGARVELEMYDLADPGYYDFAAQDWVAAASVETKLQLPTNGDVQLFKIPIVVGVTARRWRPKFFISGNAASAGVADFYYCLLANADNLGLIHYSGGAVIGRGELSIFTDATRPPATAFLAGTGIWNTSDNAMNFSDGTNWRDSAGVVT